MQRILIVGLGSMGKRRIRNLQKLGFNQIFGYDIRKDRVLETEQKYKIKCFNRIHDALDENPEIMIISTPPHLHMKYAKIAINHKIHFFIELNLIYDHVRRILDELKGKKVIVCASSTMRYHPIVKKLKKLIEKKIIGKIYSIHHYVGHYLPNWHPWENYHDFFVSRKETGGARELVPVELNWLTYVFSDIKSVYGNVGKLSKLDVDIDDFYQIILEFHNGIKGTFNVDVFSIPSAKETKIIGEKGTIICDFIKNQILIQKNNKQKILKINSGKVASGYKGITPSESLYVEEIQGFLDSIQTNKKCSFSLKDELKILKILNKIEKSSKIKKKINI